MRTVGTALAPSLALSLALCLALAGCGGASDAAKKSATPVKATTAQPTTKPTTKPTTIRPTTATPTGVPAPEDLKNFQCFADSKGAWSSSGLLDNASRKSVTYQVTVFVGQADGKDAQAKTKQYVVNPASSARVALADLPAPDGATQCYVQVLARG